MSLINYDDADCPPAHHGCGCDCHRWPGVMHCIPCCSPGGEDRFSGFLLDLLQKDTQDNVIAEIMKLVDEHSAMREWALKARGRTGIQEVTDKKEAVRVAIEKALNDARRS